MPTKKRVRVDPKRPKAKRKRGKGKSIKKPNGAYRNKETRAFAREG
jgi:hypothetical protein